MKKSNFKTFNSLIFKKHSYIKNCVIAQMNFKNGYGVSVLNGGDGIYSGGFGKDSYELAVLKDGSICSDTEITDDVLGWITSFEVSEVMEKLQQLEK